MIRRNNQIMQIRRLQSHDDSEWLRMRDALWPGLTAEQHDEEMMLYRNDATKAVFVADRGNGRLGGFLELAERSVAQGSYTSPVAYIEGWFVDPDLRQQGVGRALVEAAESYSKQHGYREIASDCVIDNHTSHRAHLALGYEETGRLIHFRKQL
jgi:aminoglycoside 6'-N-acetyltransferase I